MSDDEYIYVPTDPRILLRFPTFPAVRQYKKGSKLAARYEGQGIGQPPGLVRKAWNYFTALAKWTAAGKPVRTQERIDEIYAICSGCPLFKGGICTHIACGCEISRKKATDHKLAWATESCPLVPPKWSAEPPHDNLPKPPQPDDDPEQDH